MYKLIACDLDETLLNDNKEICERNIKAIQKAECEFGVKFIPATGRGYTCIDNVLETLQVNNKSGEYTISNNGGVISENKDFKELTFHQLPFIKAKEIVAFGLKQDVCIQVFTAKDVYAFHVNEDERSWLTMFKPDFIECQDDTIEFLKEERIAKILFQNENVPYLHEVAMQMQAITDNEVSVSFSSNRYLELNRIGVDKGLGLHELADHLGIDIKDTMAIGDNHNDAAMLKEAGLSVAVANAVEDIKNICDYVTNANNNEGGVAEAIEKFIINK